MKTWKTTEVASLRVGDRVRTSCITGWDDDGNQVETHTEFTVTYVPDNDWEWRVKAVADDGTEILFPLFNTVAKLY